MRTKRIIGRDLSVSDRFRKRSGAVRKRFGTGSTNKGLRLEIEKV